MTVRLRPLIRARAAHVQAFTDVLEQLGVPLQSRFREFDLPDVVHCDPDAYVPVPQALRMLQALEKEQGIPDLGYLTASSGQFSRLNAAFLMSISSAPTLYARIMAFARAVHLENSHVRVALTRRNADYRVDVNIACSDRLPGLRYSEWAQLMVLIELVRQSVTACWQPEEITFRARFILDRIVTEAFPRSRILTGQANTSITVEARLIEAAITAPSPMGAMAAPSTPRPEDADFIGSLESVLSAYIGDDRPDIGQAAEIAGLSVRTLQRLLTQRGTTYSHLVRKLRCDRAAALLRTTELNLSDIAHEAGYTDASNFARAFREVTGFGPEAFRSNSLKS